MAAAAHQSNLSEIQAGQVAQRKATSSVVRQHGALFIRDHTRLDANLQAVARRLGVALPSRPNAQQRAILASGGSAPVVPVAVRAGALAIPDSPRTVGWWVGSAPAGSRHGSTVLAGHVDSERLGKGTVAILHGLPLGTRIVLTDVFGARHAYAVTARRTYPKDALPADVFRGGDRPRLLLLVTYGGPFDQARGHYRDNLVVYALPTT